MEIHLVKQIKKHKAIFDKSCPTYRSRKLRAEAWQSVAEALGIPVSLCQTRWNCLRDQYVRHIQKPQHVSGRRKEYFKLMDFLREQVQPKKAPSPEPERVNCLKMEESLIEEIKKHKSIYDKTCQTYLNRKHRAAAWQSISKVLSIPIHKCQKRWKSLRDRYVREYIKTQQTPGSTADVYVSRWEFFELMNYFRQQVQSRKGINFDFSMDSFSSHEPEHMENVNNKIKKHSWQSDNNEALENPGNKTRWKSFQDRYEQESLKTQHTSESTADVYDRCWDNFEAMDDETDSNVSFSSTASEEMNCDPLQNALVHILPSPSLSSPSTEETPAKEKKEKRRHSSTLQSEDTKTVIAEKRLCPVRSPAESGEHQGFALMCRDLFKKLSCPKVDDAKVFFINYLHGQIKSTRDK